MLALEEPLPESLPDSLPVPERSPAKTRNPQALERWTFWTLVAACVVVLAVMAAPLVRGEYYCGDDLGEFHLPLRQFYSRCLANGDRFDWMPQLFCGFYLTGEGQAGVYHPLHLLLYRCLPLQVAFDLEIWLSYPIMLCGLYWFLRRHIGSGSAALAGAAAFTFGSFNLLHLVHVNAIAILAHLGWMLLALDIAIREPRSRQASWARAALSLLLASQLLLGYPQYVWFTLLALGGYALWAVNTYHPPFVRTEENDHEDRPAGPKRLPTLLGLLPALAIGLLIGGIQILPTLDALAHSTRQSADANFINSGSLHPLNLIQLVAPYLFTTRVAGENTHELGMYLGAVPLVLLMWLRSLGIRRNAIRGSEALPPDPLTPGERRLLRGALLFGSLMLLLSFGQYGPLYHLQTLLPGVGSFRFPCRTIVLFELSVAVATAIAFVALARQVNSGYVTPWKQLRPLRDLMYVVVFFAAISPWIVENISCSKSSQSMFGRLWIGHPWAGPILIAAAVVLVALAARGKPWAMPVIAVFMIADLAAYGLSYGPTNAAKTMGEIVASAPRVRPREPRVIYENIPETTELRQGNGMLLAGISRVDGYAGLEPRGFPYRVHGYPSQTDSSPRLAVRVAGAAWICAIEESSWGAFHPLEPLPNPMPRARLVAQTKTTDDPNRDLYSINIDTTALVDQTVEIPLSTPGTTEIVSDRPGNMVVTTNCPAKQLLCTTERYDEGWQASAIDLQNPAGTAVQPVQILRVNGDFLGCLVEPGEHEVHLEFHPHSLWLGRLASGCGLSLMVLGLVAGAYRRRTSGSHQ